MVQGFHAEVQGKWGCVSGAIAHLWHGNIARRKLRQRYREFTRFNFDPDTDLAVDENGAWRWNSSKPEMHRYIRDYFADRHEDNPAVESVKSNFAANMEFAA